MEAMDNIHSNSTTSPPSFSFSNPMTPQQSDKLNFFPAAEMIPSPASPGDPTPGIKHKVEAKRRVKRTEVTQNACTACRKRRKKCDGKSPCSLCGAVRSTTECVYEVSARVAKSELQRENGELRRQKALSDQIFHALRSDSKVPNILQLLKDREGLPLIAKLATSPSIESSVGSPSEAWPSATTDELLQQKYESEDCHSPETATATAPGKALYPWIAASYDEQLIKHLFSLYWTWIHPAYLLFSMEQFMEGYKTGNEEHCSAFLVAAVCAAACDLLGPHWTSISGKVPDIPALRRDFVAEAMRQEELADRGTRTWSEASRVMLIVNSRSEVTCITRATGLV